MGKRRRISTGAKTALSTSYGAIALTGIPDECYLVAVACDLDTLAGGCAKVTVALSRDSTMDVWLTDEVETTLVVGEGTATDSGFTVLIEMDYVTPAANATAGSLWLAAKTDAGTINLTPTLIYVDGD